MTLLHDMMLENYENREQKTDREIHRLRIQLQRPLLSPVDCRGERANTDLSYKSLSRPLSEWFFKLT